MKGTVKSKRDVERLFRGGRRSSSSLMTILVAPSPTGSATGRCAFIAGKKIGAAPLRNRCKRVMRQTAWELGAPWYGHDVAFIARKQVSSVDHGSCLAVMREQLVDAGVFLDG